MNNNWVVLIVVLCVILPGMLIFYMDRNAADALSEVSELVSFMAGSFFGYLTATKNKKK
jgi:hypothetical protein